MHCYIVYGIVLRSFFPLPELVVSDAPPDIDVRIGSLGGERPFTREDVDSYYQRWTTEQGTYVFWRDVATFLIRDGREIIVDAVPNVEQTRLRLVLLGAVLSVALEQRGYLMFHASSVSINGKAVMFIGNKGWGKSTIAAMLYRRGHSFIADDVVIVDDESDERLRVVPAFPQLKLWSDTISSLGDDPETFPAISTLVDKREQRIDERYSESPVPLHHIYVLSVLDDDAPPRISEVPPTEALFNLIGQTYSARWGREEFANVSASNFTRCNNIVKSTHVFRLARPKSLALLPGIAAMIEDHIENHASKDGADSQTRPAEVGYV